MNMENIHKRKEITEKELLDKKQNTHSDTTKAAY